MAEIHETAIVDNAADLADDVRIGPFTVIERDVRIGPGCVIGPRVTIMRHTTLGPNCRVHAGAALGDLPQDLGYSDCESHVTVGTDCVIREGVTIHRGTKPGTCTRIGDGCYLMGYSHFAHNVVLEDGVIVANGTALGGYVHVGKKAFLSGLCGIHQFVSIGRLAMVGACCAITRDVPPFMTMRPSGLNDVGGINVIGMRRAGMTALEREEVKKAFRILYRSGLNVAQSSEKMRAEFSGGPVAEICDFIEQSKRGICRAGSDGHSKE